MASPSAEKQPPSDATATTSRSELPPELDDRHVTDGTTRAPACQCVVPTWNGERHTGEAPCHLHTLTVSNSQHQEQQQNHHHHHHHHHHYHRHYHHQWAASCGCPPSALCSLTTSNVPSLSTAKHTEIGPPVCICTAHTFPSSSPCCIEQTDDHKLASSISPSQESTRLPTNGVDLFATPTHASKTNKRPRSHFSKLFPPLPSPASPPYVLCQHCFQLLALPLHPLEDINHGADVFELRCALCLSVSSFSMRQLHARSSSEVTEMGAISAKVSKEECRHKEELKSVGEVEPTIISSGVSKVEAELRLENADVQLLSDGEIQLETEEENGQKHVSTIDGFNVVQTSVLSYTTARDSLRGERRQLGDDINTNLCIRGVLGDASLKDKVEPPHSPPKLNPEFAGFSTVQDWVNSLEHGGFSHCPTPVMGTAFGGDLQLQEPVDWVIDEQHGNDMVPLPGSPLHEHFGYKSARELLHKTCSSDDEIKVHSDSNSSPTSTSNASANTFKPPGFDTVASPSHTRLKKSVKSHAKSSMHAEQEDQTSLANLLKRGFKGFGESKGLSVLSSKARVVVNGHALSEMALKRAEERAGKMRPGTYWYDSMAGFWGIVGGPCLGVLPPFIEEFHYPMARDCSNGDTEVFVNGRELHHKDLTLLSHRGLSRKPGRAYVVGFDGVVIEEASGQEVKHLGKLAPTVEKRGKGFGMYMEKPR